MGKKGNKKKEKTPENAQWRFELVKLPQNSLWRSWVH